MPMLSFGDLPSILPQYRRAQYGQQAGNNIAEGMIEAARRRQQQEQFMLQLQQEQAVAAQRAKHDTATLAETGRHNKAIETETEAERKAALVQRQAEAVRQIEDEVRKSGGNPEVMRAAQARLQLLGLTAQEDPTALSGEQLDAMDAAESGTSVPLRGGPSAFPGAEVGHGAPREETLAELAARDNRTGNFSLRRLDDGIEMGRISAGDIRESQMGYDSPALAAVRGMGNTKTGSRQEYISAANAAAGVPMESEADRLKLAQSLAAPAARDATSLVNAAQQSEGIAARYGAGMDIRRDQFAYAIWDKERKDVARQLNVPAIQQKVMDARRVTQLVEMAKAQDETGLMAANALGQVIKATAGARYSDADQRLFTQAFGGVDNIEQRFNNWLKSGQRTELQMRALKRLGQLAELQGLQELKVAGDRVYNQIISSRPLAKYWDQETVKAQAEQARRAIVGGAPDEAPGPADSGGGTGGASVGKSTSKSGILALPDDDDEWNPPVPD